MKALEILALHTRDGKLRQALAVARQQLSGDDVRRPSLATIEFYYLGRPQIRLAMAILALASGALALSAYGETSSHERLLFSSASVLLALVITINEAIYFW